MTNALFCQEVNFREYPIEVSMPFYALNVQQLTIGDLHANALKFIHILLLHGICEISKEHYAQLQNLYYSNITTVNDRLEFDSLINEHLKIINSHILIRLIGDELSDRGQNDYFILKIIEKLCDRFVQIEILFSNHGANFMLAHQEYEHNFDQLLSKTIEPQQTCSMSNLDKCLLSDIVDFQAINVLTSIYYYPKIKLISATFDIESNRITIYSHAPIGLLQIKWAANYFNVPYDNSSVEKLATTIDKINYEFISFIHKKELPKIFTNESFHRVNKNSATPRDVILFIAWNRCLSLLEQPETQHGYTLEFVHGHDSSPSTKTNVINLDNIIGKSNENYEGQLDSLFSDEITLLQWQFSNILSIFNEASEPNSQANSTPGSPRKRHPHPLKCISSSELNLSLTPAYESPTSTKPSFFRPARVDTIPIFSERECSL